MKKKNTTKKLPKKGSTFASRLNYLMVKSGYDPKKDQTRLSNDLKQKVTQPQFSNILKGESKNPKYETLVTLSDFFKVSIDFLVGRSDYESKNHELADISKKIGLSVQSLEKLQLFKVESEREKKDNPYYQNYLGMIDLLIKNHLSEDIVREMSNYFDCALINPFQGIDLDVKKSYFLTTQKDDGTVVFNKDLYNENSEIINTYRLNKRIIEQNCLNNLQSCLEDLRESSPQGHLKYKLLHDHEEVQTVKQNSTYELEQMIQEQCENDIRDRLDAVKK